MIAALLLGAGVDKASGQSGARCAFALSEKSRASELMSCMQEISAELQSTQQELSIVRRELAINLPSGAVAAFDLETGCPHGWSEFREAAGRMIIGTGRANTDAGGAFLTPRELLAAGGAEAIMLSPRELPQATSVVKVEPGSSTVEGDGLLRLLQENTIKRASLSRWALRLPDDSQTKILPHDNMPPFIALHVCKKN